jgi:hypothetical protein
MRFGAETPVEATIRPFAARDDSVTARGANGRTDTSFANTPVKTIDQT